ncbi:FecR family protein [Rufibacter sediminis]|uniref:FecR domain-containing protein n=1 Tax=Rufibacter sediminis TaxID=2762756 RepID=A0ABR6VPS1_9BACT|nr:FecR domain-containing protein [Rufibacter sediminis]MBC3539189.1 FecR domain-containing protein [Rufibacter sediminis]
MTREEYIILHQKYLDGTCTPQERKLLEDYQDQFELQDLPWEEAAMGSQEEVKAAIFNRLKAATAFQEPAKRRQYSSIWAVAAVITLLLASGSVFYWWQRQQPSVAVAEKTTPALAEVKPGRDKAFLTLADGTVIDLDVAANGDLSHHANIKIIKLDGQLSYSGQAPTADQTQLNTLSTPHGGQYQITLADGSKVWLNAASSLRFPAAFAGKERVVELTGEAYFEVAKNKTMPFKVKSRGMEVEVLGTHFNLMAYEDEAQLRTTLLEGSVKVSNSAEAVTIEPNQEAVLHTSSGSLKVEQVDAQESIAWKNGQFLFHDEDLRSVMRKIARWYDVEVVYEGEIDHKSFTGTVSRFEDITDVLNMLELTETVHFKRKGRRLTVMP